MTSEASFGRTMAFQLDAAGDRIKETWPDAFYVNYDYDALNRTTKVRENNATTGVGVLGTYVYDDLGRRASLTRGNGTSSAYGYDPASRLTSLAHALAGTAWDESETFGYNAASQVESFTRSNGAYSWTNHPDATVARAYDGLNRDAAVAAMGVQPCPTAGGYDLNGNFRTDGVRSFCYDAQNRLVSVTAPSTTMALTYDPVGRLYQTTVNGTVTQFLYEGQRLSAEYSSAGTVLRRYVHGAGEDEPLVWYEGSGTTSRRFLVSDRQGSIVAWADSTGAVIGSQAYGPYGEPQTWGGSRFTYTGQIAFPEVQLYHYKARAYDPAGKRFLQTDPIGGRDDLDLYAYVGDDPVDHGDPSGNCIEDACVGEAIAVNVGLGALIGGGAELLVQGANIAAGHQQGVNWGEVRKQTAIGAGAGLVGGTAGAAASKVALVGKILEPVVAGAVSGGATSAANGHNAGEIARDAALGAGAGGLAKGAGAAIRAGAAHDAAQVASGAATAASTVTMKPSTAAAAGQVTQRAAEGTLNTASTCATDRRCGP